MDTDTLVTLDELTELVGAALSVDYPGAPTGRVRDVPDQRVIRWYVTRGLVDRPAASRGRVALYGRRHLLQLVAIKRRQAQGRSLAEIQAELAGATDGTLAAVARLADRPDGPDPAAGRVAAPPARGRFWSTRPAVAPSTAAVVTGQDAATEDAAAPATPDADRQPVVLRGIRLAAGITLLIEDGVAAGVDPAAVHRAAAPLLDLLTGGRPDTGSTNGPATGHPTEETP